MAISTLKFGVYTCREMVFIKNIQRIHHPFVFLLGKRILKSECKMCMTLKAQIIFWSQCFLLCLGFLGNPKKKY